MQWGGKISQEHRTMPLNWTEEPYEGLGIGRSRGPKNGLNFSGVHRYSLHTDDMAELHATKYCEGTFGGVETWPCFPATL